jgi:hypothetical protein
MRYDGQKGVFNHSHLDDLNMAKLQVNEIDFGALSGSNLAQVTQPVIDEGAQSLKMTCHSLTDGHTLHISEEAVSHVLYIWRGGVQVQGQQLESGSVVAVEVGGEVILRATDDTLLIDFHERLSNTSHKPGGNVHIVRSDEVKGGEDGMELGFHTSYLDAECPGCDLWLHETRIYPERDIPRHYHTEDEIIFIHSGELHLGRRVLRPGTALAIAANTPYRFKSGKEGVSFVNFRSKSPTIVMFVEGKATQILDEARALRSLASGNT